MALFSKSAKKRTADMSKLAFQLDMQFHDKEDYGLKNLLKQFQLFKMGHSRKVRNLMIKEDSWLDSQIAVFDYQYTIQAGNTPVIYYQTVFFTQSKKLSLPQFLIRPEKFFDKVGKFFNRTQDIEYEENPEFSKQFLIQGEEESLVKETITEDLAHFFTIEKKWHLEGMNYFLVFYQHNKKLKPEVIEDFYKKGMKLFDWLKET